MYSVVDSPPDRVKRAPPIAASNPIAMRSEKAMVDDGAMERADLETLLRDMENQPSWRTDADLNAAYYDNKQATVEGLRNAQETGQPYIQINLVARTINQMLGTEAKNRTSWRVTSDDEAFGDVSDVMRVKLTQAQRETKADSAISEAYASMCKAGIGWVEVQRIGNPFAKYNKRVQFVHRNEIWWDFRSKQNDLSDCKWLVRARWQDLDDACMTFPKWKDVFTRYMGGWNDASIFQDLDESSPIAAAYNDRVAFSMVHSEDQWINTGRRRIKFYEVWYRKLVPATALVMQGWSGEYNPKDPAHQLALDRGIAKLVKAPKQVMRMAMFAGPHRMFDRQQGDRDMYPYVPFWGFRDDDTRAPYSPIQGMRAPQDEYNARRSRLMWLLQSVQVHVEADALDETVNTLEDLAAEINRPDAMFVLNPKRQNTKNGIDVRRDINLPAPQLEVMQDAKTLIQDQPGATSPMTGNNGANGMSGLALSGLLEQGLTAMGDFNDNYRYARQAVGELLVDLIIEDLSSKDLTVKVGFGASARDVVLNTQDEQGMPLNVVKAAALNTALEETPNTPAYRLQQQQQIAAVIQAAQNLPDAIQILLPDFIEATDLTNRMATAKLLRKRFGMPQPGDAAAEAQAEQAQIQQASEQQQLQAAAVQAETTHTQALAELDSSSAKLNLAKTAETEHKMALATHKAMLDERAQKQAEAGTAPDEDAIIDKAIAEAFA